MLQTSEEVLQTSKEVLQTSKEVLQTSKEVLQTSEEVLQTSEGVLETSQTSEEVQRAVVALQCKKCTQIFCNLDGYESMLGAKAQVRQRCPTCKGRGFDELYELP